MAEYDFPDDLLELQRNWFAAERTWEQAAPGEQATVAYRRVHEIAVALHRHPWMQGQAETGSRYKARMALRKAARA
jgi:hypothetical protein